MNQSAVASQFVDGLDYPIGKAAILRAADDEKLADEIVLVLRGLPDRDYEDAADLTSALNNPA